MIVPERMKQIIDLSSVGTNAAAMNGKPGVRGKKVAAVISDGNVDLRQLPD